MLVARCDCCSLPRPLPLQCDHKHNLEHSKASIALSAAGPVGPEGPEGPDGVLYNIFVQLFRHTSLLCRRCMRNSEWHVHGGALIPTRAGAFTMTGLFVKLRFEVTPI